MHTKVPFLPNAIFADVLTFCTPDSSLMFLATCLFNILNVVFFKCFLRYRNKKNNFIAILNFISCIVTTSSNKKEFLKSLSYWAGVFFVVVVGLSVVFDVCVICFREIQFVDCVIGCYEAKKSTSMMG